MGSSAVDAPESMTKARGGRPSGPCQLGPPCAAASTNRALRGVIRAIGSEIARERVTGFKSAAKGFKSLKIQCRGSEGSYLTCSATATGSSSEWIE